jgi:hypothetical protein
MDPRVEQFMARIKAKNPAEPEFHQAVHEVAESLIPFIEENPKYKHAKSSRKDRRTRKGHHVQGSLDQ